MNEKEKENLRTGARPVQGLCGRGPRPGARGLGRQVGLALGGAPQPGRGRVHRLRHEVRPLGRCGRRSRGGPANGEKSSDSIQNVVLCIPGFRLI